MRIQLGALALPAILVGVSILGCADRSHRPATVPVGGTVIYKEKPVEGATVGFLAPGAPRPASGTTDAAGRFRLTTFDPNDGAIVGRHVVTVRKMPPASEGPAETPAAADEPVDPAAIDAAMQQQAEDLTKARRNASLLPEKYSRRETSDLLIDVVDGPNDLTIVLED